MATVTLTLAQETWFGDGVSPILLQAIYDDVTLLVSTVQVVKPDAARPTLVVKDGTTLVTLLDLTIGAGTLITRNVASANYHIFHDSEGQIEIPWQIQFG